MDFAKDDLQAFNPRAPAYRWRLIVRVAQPDRVRLHFFWRRIAAAVALAGAGCWLLATAAIWAFLVHGREWADAKYSDVVRYPWRVTALKQGLARHNLARGQIEFEKKNYRTGYALLVAGLARIPADLQARRTVAIIQARSGLVPRALDTLVQGVDYAPDLDYLKLTFGWLLEARQFERVVALADKLLPSVADGKLLHRFVALQAASAHFECGRFNHAEQMLSRWGLGDALEGVVLLAQIDWETGLKTRALERLTAELARFSRRDELYLHLVRYHRELGNTAEARRIALLRQFNEPHGPGPRIDLLHTYHATGDRMAEEREVAAYLAEFARDQKAMSNLAWYAVDTQQDALLARVCAPSALTPEAREEFTLAKVQLALSSRRFHDAAEFSAPSAAAAGRVADGPVPLAVGLNAVANFACGDATKAGLAVKSFVSQDRVSARDALLLARELRLVGADADARVVLERASERDSFAQPVLEELVRLDARTKNQPGLLHFVPKVIALQKPSRDILAEALLAIDRVAQPALFSEVRQALQAGPKPRVATPHVAALTAPGPRVAAIGVVAFSDRGNGKDSND